MRTRFQFKRAIAIAGSALVIAMAVAVVMASATGPRARTTEAADIASMLLLTQSLQSAAAVPSTMDHGAQPAQAAAAVDYFLKIDGIPGESTDNQHRGEIDILSFSWGASTSFPSHAGGGGGGAGKVQFQDLHITMHASAASPLVFLATASGQHIPEATLTVRKAGGERQEYLKITLQDVFITSYQQAADGSIPVEQISLNFSRIEFEYYPQNPDGSLGSPVKAGWDLKANKKV